MLYIISVYSIWRWGQRCWCWLLECCYSHASMVTPTTCSRRNNVFSPSKTLKQVFLAEKSIFDLPLGYKLVDRHSAWPQIVFSIYIFYSMLEMNNFRGPLRHIMLSVIRRRKNMDIGTLTCTLRNCCVIYLRRKEYEIMLKVLRICKITTLRDYSRHQNVCKI